MVAIGYFAFRQTKDLDDYMLAGRNLKPGTAALSAGASDMSGWLLLGLPGAIYVSGLVEAWIAIGLTIGLMFYAGMISFIPAIIAVVLAEAFRLRSVIVWLAIGGAIGLLNGEATIAFDGLTFAGNVRVLCVAAGFVGGMVYWAIAGRNSGMIRATSTASGPA